MVTRVTIAAVTAVAVLAVISLFAVIWTPNADRHVGYQVTPRTHARQWH